MVAECPFAMLPPKFFVMAHWVERVHVAFDPLYSRRKSAGRVGTDSAHKKTHALLCQEYLMQSDSVIYRIRPRDEKHPVLLPVGQKAQFRIQKDKMLLQVEDGERAA